MPSTKERRIVTETERREDLDEVQYFAAELHDGIGQELTGLSMMLCALKRTSKAQDPDIKVPLENACQMIERALLNCRLFSEGLGGFVVLSEGLKAALRHLTRRFATREVCFEFCGRDIPRRHLDERAMLHLFGIGRETIWNAVRHGEAKTIRVVCDHTEEIAFLAVTDDGVGFTPADGNTGFGRHIMQYRARAIGADLKLSEAVGGGVTMECRLAFANPSGGLLKA